MINHQSRENLLPKERRPTLIRIVLPKKEFDELRRFVFHRDKWRCRVCLRRTGLTAHHIVFRSHGGDDASYNLLSLCCGCHDGLHKKNPTTGACLKINPLVDGTVCDADGQLKFEYANGWRPG